MNQHINIPNVITILILITVINGIVSIIGYEVHNDEKLAKQRIYKEGAIEAVYMHTTQKYSIMIKESNTLKTIIIGKPTIVPDVPEGSNKWYKGTFNGRGTCIESEVHIHNVDDINGAGWDKGKFGKGQTHRIDK